MNAMVSPKQRIIRNSPINHFNYMIMKKTGWFLTALAALTMLMSSCVSFRSDVSDLYNKEPGFTKKNHVKVFFDVFHYKKDVGLDVIPKLVFPSVGNGFEDIFKESAKNLSNIKNYEFFTNWASDVQNQRRRVFRDSCITASDYTLRVEILREKSFPKHFLGILLSSVSATTIPVAYTWKYAMKVVITDKSGQAIGQYQRNAKVTKWYEMLLFPLYPFFTEEKQTESLYLEMLSDIFKQIEDEGVLK